MRRTSQRSRIAPSSTMPAMPRSTAAVAMRLPIAAMSRVPSMTMTPTSPGLASSMISTECLTASVGVAWCCGRGPRQRGHGAAHEARSGHQLHVVAHRAVLAGHEFDRVRHRCRVGALEAGDHRVAWSHRVLRRARGDEGGGTDNQQRNHERARQSGGSSWQAPFGMFSEV